MEPIVSDAPQLSPGRKNQPILALCTLKWAHLPGITCPAVLLGQLIELGAQEQLVGGLG